MLVSLTTMEKTKEETGKWGMKEEVIGDEKEERG